VHSTIDDKNYLIPIGGFASLFNEAQLSDVAVSDSYLLGSTSGAKFSILLLDACRSNDFAKVRGDKGLGQPKSALNNDYIISYATDVGKTADDGYSNSPYALALSHNLLGDYPIEELFRRVRKEVSKETHGKQKPLYKPSFNEQLCLTGECYHKIDDNSQELARLRAENARYREQSSRVVVPEAKPVRVTSTSKWIIPKNSVCTNNNGKIYKGVCKANWENAKKICSASGGKLPSRADLKKVVVDCGGSFTTYGNKDWDSLTDKNIANKSYQACCKQKGFNNWYWTREEKDSSNAWGVNFYSGNDYWNNKTNNSYALCVR
jgi:hypothetical protein